MNETPPELREPQGDAVRDARMTMIPRYPVASWAITMGIGGLFLGFVGATDSYQYALWLRLVFWLGLCAVAGIIAITIEAAFVHFGLRTKNSVIWWFALTSGLAIAMVPVIFLLNSTGASSPIADLPMFTFNSFAISGALTALRLVVGAMFPDPAVKPMDNIKVVEASAAQPPAILARLEQALQSGRLLALKSEGHYLKVYTDQGAELVLIRLKDAITETAPVEGMQVHRSWWVAREAVLDRRNIDGRLELGIDEEVWVPVSRSYRAAWKAAGW